MDNEESKIDRLERTLYSRKNSGLHTDIRSSIPEQNFDVKTSWGDKPDYSIPVEKMIKRNNSFFNKFLLGSVVFLAVSFAVAIFIFFGGLNTISSNNLNVEVQAPTSVSSGEELSIGLTIENGNRTNLEETKLFIDYPIGMYSVTDESKQLTHEEASLGVIEKGQSIDKNIRGVLFGEKDTVKTIKFRIEYKVNGSNAIFSKEKNYDVVIGSSPILLNVVYPKEVNSGQDLNMSIEVTSNSSVPVKDTLVKIEYPYGFTYKSSNITPAKDNSIWNLGDLKNGDKKVINITGAMIGQNEEDRSFRISIGSKLPNTYDFDATLASSLITMGIRKSFFNLSINTNSKDKSIAGQPNFINLKWQNTLPDKIVDSVLEVKLSGTAFDRNNVSVPSDGFYRSIDDTIVWDKTTASKLSEILPGQDGSVMFTVSSLQNLVSPKLVKNPYLNIDLKMQGTRTGRDGGTVVSNEKLQIKISTQLVLTAKTLRNTGPFTNTGSIPPRADKESTYTINWALTNTVNDVKSAQVKTTLPPGVVWKGEISPSSEKISYDPDNKIVTWDAGNISAGSGFTNSGRQVFFKVGITPSVNQVGANALITGQASVTATDMFTNVSVGNTVNSVSTKYTEPGFVDGNDVVGN